MPVDAPVPQVADLGGDVLDLGGDPTGQGRDQERRQREHHRDDRPEGVHRRDASERGARVAEQS